MADGYAVKELLKIVDLLFEAVSTKSKSSQVSQFTLNASEKMSQIRLCRALASSITEKGSIVYDLLGKESDLRVTFLILRFSIILLEPEESSFSKAI